MKKEEIIKKIKEVAKNKNITTYSFYFPEIKKADLQKILYCFEASEIQLKNAWLKFKKEMPNYAEEIKNEYLHEGYYRCGLYAFMEV